MAVASERKSRLLGAGEIDVSFEFFPPKTEKMEQALWGAVERLAPLRPEFVSVTYGAGGSTRERTHNTVVRIVNETALKPAAHLTCVAASREEVDAVAKDYWESGVRHIVALRGDPAGGPNTVYEPHPGGYINAADLVAGLKRIAPFEVSVAGYPEKHPDSPTARSRHGQPQGQGRCRRRPHHHPVRLRQRALPALPGARPRRRHLGADHARHRAHPQLQAGGGLCRPRRRVACRRGWRDVSTAWKTTRRRAISSLPPSPPSR